MKIALVTDTHAGVRNDNQNFADNHEKFWSKIFFPELKERGIKQIIHLGDFVDRRKYINFLTAQRLRTEVFEPIDQMGLNVELILGNHDVMYKNTNDVNAANELLMQRKNWKFFDTPINREFDGRKVLYLPWITEGGEGEALDAVSATDAVTCFGHLEINGFTMSPGAKCHDGLKKSTFDKFELVCSGHFHHRSTAKHIKYLGSPYEMTWADYGNQKGFHIWDTETNELEFIKNPYKIFGKIVLDSQSIHLIHNIDPSRIDGKLLNIEVRDFLEPDVVDQAMEHFWNMNPAGIEKSDTSEFEEVDEEHEIDSMADTLTIFNEYVDNMSLSVNPKDVKAKVRELYQEALSIE